MPNLSSARTQFPNIFGSRNKKPMFISCPAKVNFRSFFAWLKHFAFSPDTVTTKQRQLSLLTVPLLLNIQFHYLKVGRCFYGRVLHMWTMLTEWLLFQTNFKDAINWIMMVSFFHAVEGNVTSKMAKEQPWIRRNSALVLKDSKDVFAFSFPQEHSYKKYNQLPQEMQAWFGQWNNKKHLSEMGRTRYFEKKSRQSFY